MNLATKLLTWAYGDFVGEDEFGNRYYQHKKADKNGKKRRWVNYAGAPEGSKIPAGWHAWIHYSTSVPPKTQKKHFWEKSHLHNLTGTSKAYYPQELNQKTNKKSPELSYEPWNPSNV